MAPKEKQKRDDNAKDDAGAKSGRIPIEPIGAGAQDDKIGALSLLPAAKANTENQQGGEQQTIKDNLDIVTQSFHWMSGAAQAEVNKLGTSLDKSDDPPWQAKLGEVMLDVALAAGAAAAGEFIAIGLVTAGAEVAKEFVKSLFEQGIDAGIDAGKKRLGGDASASLAPFIDSQQEGVAATHNDNQKKFLKQGRHHVQTVEASEALVDACSRDNINKAAVHQANATRDAWVSYLAQSKFGSDHSNPARAVTTNMATQQQRDDDRAAFPELQRGVPARAPDIGDSAMGHAPGVLAVTAKLPDISNGAMHGAPEVTLALLNGLNKENREKYLGPLSEQHIPRQIKAKVDGGKFSDFSFNLDETGAVTQDTSSSEPWLVARGSLAFPANESPSSAEPFTNSNLPLDKVSRSEKLRTGLELLLSELDVKELRDKFFL